MTPNQVRIMSEYFDATERLADATDALIKAHEARRTGSLGNCAHFEEVASLCLALYRKARADYEGLGHKD